jgi:DNA-directed RNA polymerase subunit RPC12/RpoP
MERVFRATCTCGKTFPVDYGIRHAGVLLECPYCRKKFLVDDAAKLDERWN